MGKRNLKIEGLTDELFIAQLGIVSIQKNLDMKDPSVKRWNADFEIRGKKYVINGTCDYGRPRGVDADILTALETLFVAEACPEDNTIDFNAHELLSLLEADTSSEGYERIRQSLLRLFHVSFVIEEANTSKDDAWHLFRGRGLRLFDSFSYIGEQRQNKGKEEKRFVRESRIDVTLSKPFAESIRKGYTQILDQQLYKALQQPVARALYRILNAHKPQNGVLEVSLMDWATLCGISHGVPDRIKRTLSPAHKELLSNGYLKEAQYLGRGKQTTVIYIYAPIEKAQQSLVDMLLEVNVAKARAELLASKYPERVELVVDYVKSRMATGKVRSPGGMAHDILANPDKYQMVEPAEVIKEEQIQPNTKAYEDQKQLEHEAEQTRLRALPFAEQWKHCQSAMRLLVKKDQLKALEGYCQTHSAVDLREELTRLKLVDPAGLEQRLLIIVQNRK